MQLEVLAIALIVLGGLLTGLGGFFWWGGFWRVLDKRNRPTDVDRLMAFGSWVLAALLLICSGLILGVIS